MNISWLLVVLLGLLILLYRLLHCNLLLMILRLLGLLVWMRYRRTLRDRRRLLWHVVMVVNDMSGM